MMNAGNTVIKSVIGFNTLAKLLIFSLIYLSISSISFAQVVASMKMAQSSCKKFMDDIVLNYDDNLSFEREDVSYSLPFYIAKVWDESKVYEEKNENEKRIIEGDWKFKRDSENNIFISDPAPPLFNPKFFPNDKILEVNGKKVSKMNDKELSSIFEPIYKKEEIGKKYKIKISRAGEIKILDAKVDERKVFFNSISIILKDLNLNIQEGNISTSIDFSVTAYFDNLKKFTDKHFVEGDISYGCEYSDDEINIMQLARVDEYIQIINSKIADRDAMYRGHEINSMIGENYSVIKSIEKKTLVVNQDFKLKSFPFDQQVISIQITAAETDYAPYTTLTIDDISELKISQFIKNVNIPGWKIIDYSFENGIYQPPTFFNDAYSPSLNLNIILQRSYEFYIFKIIIPILLILMICWSVLWINPSELESRLTITIVCLLSLIAYNFVIDKDLPKLSYLTIMDYMILTSYIYAAIPNFISVASFKLCKTNPSLCSLIESNGRKFGPLSYIIIIFLTVVYAINDNPYTANFLAGLS